MRVIANLSAVRAGLAAVLIIVICDGCGPREQTSKLESPKTIGVPTEISLERLLSIANDPHSPIKFDSNVNEFQLVYSYETNGNKSTVRIPLEYCPFTGIQLPSSDRPSGLLSADGKAELHNLSNRIKEAHTLEEIEEILGPPSFHYEADLKEPPEGNPSYYRLGNSEDFRRQITYTNISAEVRFTITEDHKGNLKLWSFQQ